MNRFLKTREEIDICTEYLQRKGLIEHVISCKNWDIANVILDLSDGDILDMGCVESYILQNALMKGLKGLKYGIDLRYGPGEVIIPGAEYFTGDLTKCPFEDKKFDYITCLSVIEHNVDFKEFARECSRLLKPKGKLYVTFDYWDPKQRQYDPGWNILNKDDVLSLIDVCSIFNLKTGPIDWTIQDQVINQGYYSPSSDAYTFGMLVFYKDGN